MTVLLALLVLVIMHAFTAPVTSCLVMLRSWSRVFALRVDFHQLSRLWLHFLREQAYIVKLFVALLAQKFWLLPVVLWHDVHLIVELHWMIIVLAIIVQTVKEISCFSSCAKLPFGREKILDGQNATFLISRYFERFRRLWGLMQSHCRSIDLEIAATADTCRIIKATLG